MNLVAKIVLFAGLAAAPAAAQTQTWIRQFGTGVDENAWAAAPDGAGGVYLGGHTLGDLGGTNAGHEDAWLARYDRAGSRLWVRQFGSVQDDAVVSATADGAGGVYVVGVANGDLGNPAGGFDAWVARYNSQGDRSWLQPIETPGSDLALECATDGSGGVFVAGSTSGSLQPPPNGGTDAWIARYDGTGWRLWIRQFGTADDDAIYGLAPDGAGGAFITGYSTDILGDESDIWYARYDGSGSQLWMRHLSLLDYNGIDTAAPDGAGGLYIAGDTIASPGGQNQGGDDVWIARYNSAGDQLWIRQFGTTTDENVAFAAPDESGGVFFGGSTLGNLAAMNSGEQDAWAAHYDSLGNRLWIKQWGTGGDEYAFNAAADGSARFYILGTSSGSLGAPNAGGSDVWLTRFIPCYANCDQSTALPILNINDFQCFVNAFAAGNSYANCDSSTTPPILNINDFQCFVNQFAAGCS